MYQLETLMKALERANNLVASLELELEGIVNSYNKLQTQHLQLQDETIDLLKFKLTALTHGIKDATDS
jgi:hypothetical protein